VPLVGATLARLSLGDCAELARLAVEADTAASARAAVHERVRGRRDTAVSRRGRLSG